MSQIIDNTVPVHSIISGKARFPEPTYHDYPAGGHSPRQTPEYHYKIGRMQVGGKYK